ncbi:MAG TPA: hypothetical protein VGB99_03085 [Acidobacteriota bacterium]
MRLTDFRRYLHCSLSLSTLLTAAAILVQPAGAAGVGAGSTDRIRITPSPHTLLVITSTSRGVYTTGDRLEVGLTVDNGGIDAVVDLYFGMLLPDGSTVVSFTDFGFQVSIGTLADLRSLRPIARNLDLITPFHFSQPEFYSQTWSGSEAPGSYAIFFLAARIGALDDNQLDPEEVVAADVAFFSFTP